MQYYDNLPLVSVIMPCYNAGKYLAESLESVAAQTYKNWECIFINDGSSDNSVEIAEYYARKDHRIRCLSQPNQGPSAARNNGIKVAKGEFLIPLDADDLIEPTYMEKAISHFINFPETKLVYCKADKFGEESGEWKLPKYSYDNLIRSNCLFSAVFFRRTDFEKTGGFNLDMRSGLEDWELWLELLRPNDVVYQIDEILFHYRIRSASRSTEAYLDKEALYLKMRAINNPEFVFARERFAFRKHLITWPFKVFSQETKEQYINFYGEKWKAFRIHDIQQCIAYPYMLVYRRLRKCYGW